MYEKIPDELKKYKNWVCWKAFPSPKENDPNHVGKRPVNAVTGTFASSIDPETWCDYETAVHAAEQYSGIGFVFTNTPFFGVDIDGVEDDCAAADCAAGLFRSVFALDFTHVHRSRRENTVFLFFHIKMFCFYNLGETAVGGILTMKSLRGR